MNPRPGAAADARPWVLGEQYVPQLGGVVPMMRALLRAGRGRWLGRSPLWVTLGAPGIPARLRTSEGYALETVHLSPRERGLYVRFKEDLWRSFHGPRGFVPSPEDYLAFLAYNYRTALKLLSRSERYDLFHVNDFQQVLVGGLIGASAPSLLHWHIPLDFRGYPEPVRRFFLKSMEGFDAIVVSTRSGLEDLIHAGFQGRAFQVYPFIDPEEHPAATDAEVVEFRDRWGLGEGPVVLSVSRMDPVKRQDLLIHAFVTIRRHFPSAKLVLVGGGSFSTQPGGLGGSKAHRWRSYLEGLVRGRGLGRSVVFTGTLPQETLPAAYRSADVFVHPAPWEGFGLVAIEAWRAGLPIVVSRGAGVAELVSGGVNGYAVPPGNVHAIATRVVSLLKNRTVSERIGVAGELTAQHCFVNEAVPRLREIYERTIELYTLSGMRATRRGTAV